MNAPNGIHNYAYNNIYELTGVSGAQTHAFTYDSVGNRTLADGTAYVPNNLNQYNQVGPELFTYDGNGNLTDDGPNGYTYDVENRLISVQNVSHTATYDYDGLERRISKTVDGSTTYFIYDGDRVIEERDAAGVLDVDYVYGEGIDEILTAKRYTLNPGVYYYFHDGLGSVTDITNANGEVIESYQYDVYGQPLTLSTIGNRYYFAGREFDVETGLYHNRARTLNPSIGRFHQRDPIGNVDSENLYQYTDSVGKPTATNPNNFTNQYNMAYHLPVRFCWRAF